MKLEEIIKPYVFAEETCKEVRDYFLKENEPKGPYIVLAKTFENNGIGGTCTDVEYYKWIKGVLDNEKTEDSIVLTTLCEKYSTMEELKKFVLEFGGMSPKFNQKWHFFIAYWGLREFVTKYPDKNKDRISELQSGYTAYNRNPFQNCKEGKIWYENTNVKSINE